MGMSTDCVGCGQNRKNKAETLCRHRRWYNGYRLEEIKRMQLSKRNMEKVKRWLRVATGPRCWCPAGAMGIWDEVKG